MYAIRSYYGLIDFYRLDNLALPIEVVIAGQKRPLFASSHVKAAAKALGQDFHYWLPSDPKHARITSYNVCYTKLLRERFLFAMFLPRFGPFAPFEPQSYYLWLCFSSV